MATRFCEPLPEVMFWLLSAPMRMGSVNVRVQATFRSSGATSNFEAFLCSPPPNSPIQFSLPSETTGGWRRHCCQPLVASVVAGRVAATARLGVAGLVVTRIAARAGVVVVRAACAGFAVACVATIAGLVVARRVRRASLTALAGFIVAAVAGAVLASIAATGAAAAAPAVAARI